MGYWGGLNHRARFSCKRKSLFTNVIAIRVVAIQGM